MCLVFLQKNQEIQNFGQFPLEISILNQKQIDFVDPAIQELNQTKNIFLGRFEISRNVDF